MYLYRLPDALASLGNYAFSRGGSNIMINDISNTKLTDIPMHAFSYTGVYITDFS
jgi:hypothetical protein